MRDLIAAELGPDFDITLGPDFTDAPGVHSLLFAKWTNNRGKEYGRIVRISQHAIEDGSIELAKSYANFFNHCRELSNE